MVLDNHLSIVTFIPLIAAAIMALLLRGEDEAAQKNAKWLALAATSATFLASLFVLTGFDASNPDFQFVEEREWSLGLTYTMGVDGISVLFVMLTTFLMPIVILACWDVTHRIKESQKVMIEQKKQEEQILVAKQIQQAIYPDKPIEEPTYEINGSTSSGSRV